MTVRFGPAIVGLVALALVLPGAFPPAAGAPAAMRGAATDSSSGPASNFSAAVNRLVELVAGAGAGVLSLVWARVALSWFSNDVTKKVQAKDRARDALIGTLLFMAAISGIVYGLAQWVVTGA
jgi:hypothetical protein